MNTDEEKAVAAAERIRKDIAKDPINYRDEVGVPVTVKIGISAYKNGASIQNLMDDEDTKSDKKQKKVSETKSGLFFSELLYIG